MPTGTACLTRIGRIDSNVQSPSFFRFGVQLTEECRPRGICYAFGKTMVVSHPVDLQVFDTDNSKLMDDLVAFLMGEVGTSERYSFVNTSNGLAMLALFRRTFCQFALLALHLCQRLFFFPKEARVRYLRSLRKGSEGLESHVNPYLGRHTGQAERFALNRKAHVPLASSGTLDGTGFELAFQGPMIDHLHRANLGESDTSLMGEAKSTCP